LAAPSPNAPRRLAVAAAAEFPHLREDWPLLRHALAELGVAASTEVWTDPTVPWPSFDLIVANGAWDHIHHTAAFLVWVDAVARQTAVVNRPEVLRWSIDKRYLAALAAAGVPTVPTTWVSPGGAVPPFPVGEFVVKPTISGGGFETARYQPAEGAAARAHIDRLLAAGRSVMLQPYQRAVDTEGETGLVFLGGTFSHAIGKGPLLRPGAGVQTHLYAQEQINAVTPTGRQLATARSALGAAEGRVGPITYARVDLITLADGDPAVLELELLDPALFLETAPAAANRFARVLRDLIDQIGQASEVASAASTASTASAASAAGSAAPDNDSGTTTGVPSSSAKSAQAACASVSGMNSPSA
jgi:glutathione synthase/RimK-type ligase-like ATP-grasp enzyme